MTIKKTLHNNGLAIAMFSIFTLAIIGMSVAGWHASNNELADHNQPAESYISYLGSGDFVEGVFENWESEFLQMWALVVLTIFLRQKGSADSKPMRGKAPEDTRSRYSIIQAGSWQKTGKAARHLLYSHSLGMALLALFIISFTLHALGGTAAYNQQAMQHGNETLSAIGFVMTPEFWYQSLQNWQSEFLAVGTLIVLSIKLRERGSPESKPVGKRYDHETGS
jgi:hypothetical protein